MSEGRFYANVVLGLISVGSFTLMVKHQFLAFMANRERKQAFNTKEFTPHTLTESVNFNTDYIKKNFTQIENGFNGAVRLKGKVFLAGLTYENNPIYSNFYEGLRNIPVIYKVRYDQDVYSLDVQDPKISTYSRLKFPENAIFTKRPSFVLRDAQDSDKYAIIDLKSDTDIKSCIQYLGSKDNFRWRTIGERVAGFFALLVKLILQIVTGKDSPASKKIRGIKLGIRETEVGIKLDTPILAYGEVIYDFSTNQCRMESPIALTNDKMQYLQQINEKLAEYRWIRNVTGAIFATTAIYFLRRLFLYNKKYQLIKKCEQKIALYWIQAQQQSWEQCSKLKKRNKDEEQQAEQNDEGEEYRKPCEIDVEFYNDFGQECIRCKNIYQQTQEKVSVEEDKIEKITNSHKNNNNHNQRPQQYVKK